MSASMRTSLLHGLMWLLAALALALALLEAGAWTRTETFRGPFEPHPRFPGVHVLTLGKGLPLRCCLSTGDDTRDEQDRSRAVLVIDGEAVSPAHRQPRHIAVSGAGFGHWDNEVHFAAPPGITLDGTATARVSYPVRPRNISPAEPAALALLLALFLFGHRLSGRAATRICLLPAHLALAAALLLLAAGLVYAGMAVQSALAGSALPAAAPIRDHGWAAVLASFARMASYAILLLAVPGTLGRYLCTKHDPRSLDGLDRAEGRLLRLLAICGLPLALLLGILCVSAPWAGLPLTGEIGAASIAGLIPISDAAGYLADGYDIQRLGHWSDFSARRSIAAAFRTFTLMAAGNSQAGMLLVQTLLVCTALFIASVSVARWRGLWAGLAFFAIGFGIVRGYLSTSLTEPLGFFWALLAIPFFIASLRRQSLWPGIAGAVLMTLALLTRMGAMFAVPAIALWLAWHFGRDWPGRARAALVVLAALLVPVFLNISMQKAFTDGDAQIGGNFAYTLCGLSVGAKWTGCLDLYEQERARDPGISEETFLYRKAVENILAKPHVIALQLASGAAEFAVRLPRLLVIGIDRTDTPRWFPSLAILVIAIGLLVARRRGNLEPGEGLFWLLLVLATLASAAFVYLDAGRRVMIAIYPLAALLLVCGLGGAKPASRPGPAITLAPAGLAALAVLMAMIAAPAWASLMRAERQAAAPASRCGTLGGGRLLTGFLVLPDGDPLPDRAPAFHLSTVRRILSTGYVEDYQPVVTPPAAPPPFGLVTGACLDGAVKSGQRYIVPAEMLLRRDVAAWRLRLEPPEPGRDYWSTVTGAEPLGE